MSALEIKKLVRIIDYDFVIPEASDLSYDKLVVDQRAANGLIRSNLGKHVASQYLHTSMDGDSRKLWKALRKLYNWDLVLNLDYVQEQIINLRSVNERLIEDYVDTVRLFYGELAQGRGSAIPIYVFDTLVSELPSDWEAIKYQIQTMVNVERKDHEEQEESRHQLHAVKEMHQSEINILVKALGKLAEVTK